MLHSLCSIALELTVVAVIAAAGLEDQTKTDQDAKARTGKEQQATITKVDAKSGTITVKMKDMNGKDSEKVFKLTEDIRYFDSTGKAVAFDIFQSGDQVLVVEAEGRLKEMHRGREGRSGSVDRDFIWTATEINMAEMKLGQLAKEQASSPTIKKLGERLVTDHTTMSQQLNKLAQTQGMKLPDKLDKKHQDLVNQLTNLKASAFDREFAKDMVSGHEQAVQKFEAETKNGQDSTVKTWAEKWLPALREHLDLARQALKEVNPNR